MDTDLDIWRTANLLNKRHGAADAAIATAQPTDELLATGGFTGQIVW